MCTIEWVTVAVSLGDATLYNETSLMNRSAELEKTNLNKTTLMCAKNADISSAFKFKRRNQRTFRCGGLVF